MKIILTPDIPFADTIFEKLARRHKSPKFRTMIVHPFKVRKKLILNTRLGVFSKPEKVNKNEEAYSEVGR